MRRRSRKKLRFTVLKFTALFLVLLTTLGTVLGVWYMSYLEGVVSAKFEGRTWKFPSRIYSDTYLMYPGMNLRLEALEVKLLRLGYRETDSKPRSSGEYRFLKKEGLAEIYLHNFQYPLGAFKGIPVRLIFRPNSIAKILSLESGKEIFSLELEPELVAGLYDRTWEERRLVTLAEVPPPPDSCDTCH